jgi:hypothetical protein
VLCAITRYDAEEADSSRRQSDRAMLSSPPSRAAHSPDDAPVYPIQQSEMSAGRLPSSSYSAAPSRPSGSHISQVPTDPARPVVRTHYSWPPPSTSGDPRTSSTHGAARPSVTWSPSGTNFPDTNPAAQHNPYYSQPQTHQPPPTTSPNVNPRELYLSQQYARTGTSGWTSRTPTSPDITDRRISTAHPLGSMTPNQPPPYTSPYLDEHRRDAGYDGASQRGA